MYKYVLIKIGGYGKWKITTYENYTATVTDGNKYVNIYDCYTVLDALTVIERYFHVAKSDVKVIDF